MEKEIRDFEINLVLDWAYGKEIKTIREDLDAIEALGGTHVYIEPDIFCGCPTLKIHAFARRLETDEDLNVRLAAALKRAEEFREAEIKQLERLKAKYGQ